MADQLKLRGGSEDASKNFTGAAREVTVDTTDWTLRVHDGVTAGGHKLLKSGSCLVVEEADKCDPTKPTCKVTVNGELDVGGDVHFGGDVIIDGSIDLGDIVVDLESDDVTLRNPGDYTFGCNVPDADNQKTQADANSTFYDGIRILDEKLCIAQNEIQVLETQYQQLDNRVDQNEIDIAELKKEIDNLKQEIIDLENAIKLLEVEIENNANAILDHEGRISALEAKIDQITTEINDLTDALSNLRLNDLADCAVPAPKDGQQLVFRNGQWAAEDNAFADQAVHFMGFVNVEDDPAPTSADVKAGDTYIQHTVSEAEATANSSWTGIVGEQVAEGQYVMYGADSKWHKGKTVESVDQIQSNWAEGDVASPAYIQNKPNIEAIVDSQAGDGQINVDAGDGLSASGLNATANQKVNTTRTLSVRTGNGIDIDGNGNVIIDPNWNLDGNVTPPNNGVLTVKDHTGVTVGTFTANQAGNTDVTLPEGFSGEWNDLNGKPTEFPPSNHTHSYNDLTDKPTIPTVNDGTLTIKNSDGSVAGTFTANQVGNTDVTMAEGFSGEWNDLNGKPTEFPPSNHSHSYNDLTDKPTIGDGTLTIKNSDGTTAGSFTANQTTGTNITLPAEFSGNWSDINGKPTEFPPSAHGHAWSEITGKPCIYECNTYIGSLTELP